MTFQGLPPKTYLIASLLLFFLFACGQELSDKKAAKEIQKTAQPSLTIEPFSTFPSEIDGCSCYFSNDSIDFNNGKYIYVNDFAQISFLKINGVLTKFTQTEFSKSDKGITKARYKADKYQMAIEVKDGKSADGETMMKTGTIKVTDKNGRALIKNFYGECGC